MLRKEFTLDAGHGAVSAATLHVTAHGIVEPTVNGTAVSDEVLTPGWSSYEWRLRYRELRRHRPRGARPRCSGSRSATAGTAADSAGAGAAPSTAPSSPAWRELHVEFADGHRQVVGTDDHVAGGPVRDHRERPLRRPDDRRPAGLDRVDGSGGGPDRMGRRPRGGRTTPARLQPYVGPPVRRQEVLHPVKVWTSPAGATLVDFGQNLVGWLRFTVRGPVGTRDHPPARRGARARRARHPPAALGEGDGPLRPQRGRGRLRADQDLPRLPLRRGDRLARRADPRRPRGGRGALRAAAHRHLRVLRRAAQPAAPQRRLGPQGQLPRRAHRLPAARRAAGLDR